MKSIERFRVAPGSKVKLGEIDLGFTDKHLSKELVAPEIEKDVQRLRQLQYMLYADGRSSVLICLQALDAAGKDGTINHVLGAMNPQGTKVHGFKVPTSDELAHDFLWRIHQRTPAKGEVAIFNRSHYEDVLVVRVHQLVPEKVWRKRYDRINEFEKNLVENGTTILKLYLHISEEEQLRRFEQRLEDPMRHWKISESDYSERKLWPEYREAYEDVFHETSTAHAPWYVIPADHKWFRNFAVGAIVVDAMAALDLKLPPPKVNIDDIRKKYHAAMKAERRAATKEA